MPVADRVAVVTGGASGIGRAVALAFAERGAGVAILDADAGAGEAVAASIADRDGDAIALDVDVSSADAVAAAFGDIDAHFGRLDYGVNAAGMQGPVVETAECADDTWTRTIAVNLTGVFLALKHELRALLRSGGGAIVNVASNFGLVGSAGMPAYVASKHGVVGLTKVAALEYATRGVRVNALCPGGTDTPWIHRNEFADPEAGQRIMDEVVAGHPMQRLATPEEIAATALWLCSDAAAYVNGAAIAADGGYVAR
jgi:NAD(P)-dependent dehydrogenase (short-subunit alcohol dehydrogenase family)